MGEAGSMEGRVALVTGATSGIGRATARSLAARGSTLAIVARDPAKGEATATEIARSTRNDRVEVFVADLSSQASIHALARSFQESHDRLDVLVNCAGAFFRERRVTVDGLEMTFALNHLAYFLLTNELLPALRRSDGARILNVTAPATTKLDFDDLQGERRYRPFHAFGASKIANLLFTFELARRLEGTGVSVDAVHPGRVRTSLMQGAPAPFRQLTSLGARTPEQAGEAIADLATLHRPAGTTGRFFKDGREIEPSGYARDVTVQHRLWEVSEELTATSGTSRNFSQLAKSCEER
jgi:NAD(P)-dependent dehydrogenase (short-subunit alcohol dehydrogenase family)